MVLTRTQIQNKIGSDLDKLELATVNNSVKPLLVDFVYAFKEIIGKYDHAVLFDLLPLTSECLGKLGEALDHITALELSLKESESEKEHLEIKISKEKRSYELMIESALKEEERNNALQEEIRILKLRESSFQNLPKAQTVVIPNPNSGKNHMDWKEVKSNHKNIVVKNQIQFQLKTENQFEILNKISSEPLSPSKSLNTHNKDQNVNNKKTQRPATVCPGNDSQNIKSRYPKLISTRVTREIQTIKKRKVLVISDSHGHMMSELLSRRLGHEYAVSAVVRPGAPLNYVVHDLPGMVKEFTTDDTVVIMGGANDIGKDSGLSLCDTVRRAVSSAVKTTVILCTIPYRYDKAKLNTQISDANQEFKNNLDIPNLVIHNINSGLVKKHYTRHGLHMNKTGKKVMSRILAKCIEQCYGSDSGSQQMGYCSMKIKANY
ncbi:hypothetical protein J6590_062102 [Homalodisca vitripennis]|nr:hypothetical protein J6590_062102 [Homalodisca vitripennis]